MGRTVVFHLPYPKDKTKFCRDYSLNAFYSGKYWAKRKREMDGWHMVVLSSLKKQRVRKALFSSPVQITFFWDDRLDIDNHAVIGKATVDALKGYLLVNDGPKWFREVRHKYWKGGEIRVEVEEIE